LDAKAYILNVVIGPKVHHVLSSDDHDVLLKLAGYTLGASAVDQLLAYWADPPVWPASLAQLEDAALETLRAKLLMQAWILSQTLPTDAATAARLPAIRHLLGQAGVLGQGSAGEENSPLPVAQMGLDFRTFLAEPEAAAFHTPAPARTVDASSVRELVGADIPCPRASQAVPA
jgi:hypothetical protein